MIQVAGHHGDGNHALLWVVFALLLVVLLVALVSLVLDYYHRSNEGPPAPRGGPPEGALAVLDNRYASGELKRSDYLQAREDLLGAGGAPAATSSS
jgi:uncharacterized membrane protein